MKILYIYVINGKQFHQMKVDTTFDS